MEITKTPSLSDQSNKLLQFLVSFGMPHVLKIRCRGSNTCDGTCQFDLLNNRVFCGKHPEKHYGFNILPPEFWQMFTAFDRMYTIIACDDADTIRPYSDATVPGLVPVQPVLKRQRLNQ
jgi:hypothetical protein